MWEDSRVLPDTQGRCWRSHKSEGRVGAASGTGGKRRSDPPEDETRTHWCLYRSILDQHIRNSWEASKSQPSCNRTLSGVEESGQSAHGDSGPHLCGCCGSQCAPSVTVLPVWSWAVCLGTLWAAQILQLQDPSDVFTGVLHSAAEWQR